MVDDKLKINLLIDSQRYPLTILRQEEKMYRDAAKQIDNTLNKYRKRFPELSSERHWAMAALELAFENLSLKDRNDTRPFLERIKSLEEDIQQCLPGTE